MISMHTGSKGGTSRLARLAVSSMLGGDKWKTMKHLALLPGDYRLQSCKSLKNSRSVGASLLKVQFHKQSIRQTKTIDYKDNADLPIHI